jgi:hypothetical protein
MSDVIIPGTATKRTIYSFGGVDVFALSRDNGAEIKDEFDHWVPVAHGVVSALNFFPPLLQTGANVTISHASAVQDGYISAAEFSSFVAKEPAIALSTSSYYYRGDKTWAVLNAATIGLSNVENTALSTWAGSTNLILLGTIGTGIWQGSSIGTAYTDAKVASVNSRTGAVVILASDVGAGSTTTDKTFVSSPPGTSFIFTDVISASVSGNAGTVTNGLYSNATYTNPSWLTTVDGAKITGANSIAASVLPANLTSLAALSYASASFVKMSASGTFSLDTRILVPEAPSDGTCYGRKNAAWAATSGLRWLGAYNPSTAYVVDDAVSYAGSSYICISPSTGNLPTDLTYFNLLSHMGDPGVSGISGSLTQAFTSQTSVTVTHNFNGYPAVQVLEGTTVLVPLSIVHNSVNDFTVTFTSSTSGNIIATLGGVSTSVVSKSSNYTLTASDDLVLATAALTLTLPATSGLQGHSFTIKHMTDSGLFVIVNTTGGATIDGDLTKTLVAKYTSMTVFTDGSNWLIR